MKTSEFRKLIREEVRKAMNEATGTKVFVLQYYNESADPWGPIHSIYRTKAAAEAAMKVALSTEWDLPLSMEDNKDGKWMFITETLLF